MEELTILPKKPKENNREYAYRLLRYNIMTLVLKPGDSVNENEIAEQLGVSRTPIHEAVTLLKSEYLVDIIPQSGSSISFIKLSTVREGLFMRSTLEPAIYRQLAGNIPSEYLRQMLENLKEADQIVLNSGDAELDHYIQLDDAFHKIAYMAAQKPALWIAMQKVCSQFQRIRYQESLLIKEDMTRIHGEHRLLYEYLLMSGSPYFNLDSFYDQHLSYFKSYLPRILENYPEYYIID